MRQLTGVAGLLPLVPDAPEAVANSQAILVLVSVNLGGAKLGSIKSLPLGDISAQIFEQAYPDERNVHSLWNVFHAVTIGV